MKEEQAVGWQRERWWIENWGSRQGSEQWLGIGAVGRLAEREEVSSG